MFKSKESSQNEYEFVSIDELVPDDHLHLKANANKNKVTRQEVEVNTREYFDDLNKAIEEDRLKH